MSDKAALFRKLEPLLRDPRQGADGRVWSFCPAHSDGQKHGKRSLSLHPTIGLNCFAGCTFESVVTALLGNRPPTNGHHPSGLKPMAEHTTPILKVVYEYRDVEGRLVAEKGRFEAPDGRKTFRWRLPGEKDWNGLGNLKMPDVPLYGAEMVAKADLKVPVWFVEGEKAQRALALHDFLAVTHGGGAGTRDFGRSLDILSGRTVYLWPDNDVPGRAYMQTLQSRLRGIAATIAFVTPPMTLPEKGDAHDYFQRGGTTEALWEAVRGAAPLAPTVELTGEDSVLVTYPLAGPVVSFAFDGITTSQRSFEADLTVAFKGQEDDAYSRRINTLSASQVVELRRELDGLYGKEHEWTKVVNKVATMARRFYIDMDQARDVADGGLESAEEMFAVPELLPRDGGTILFGDGGVGKGFLACSLALAFATGRPFLGIKTPGQPVLYVDYEDTYQVFVRRIHRLGGEGVLRKGQLQYWPARGIPLGQQAEALRLKMTKDGIAFVIIDSAILACDGAPEDAQVAKALFSSLRRIGGTQLLIAHITKAGDDKKPFGSVVWHNSARRTWYVHGVEQEAEADSIDVALVCRKVNNGRWPRSIPVRITFQDPAGPIAVERVNLIPALKPKAMTWVERIADALREAGAKPMTALEIAMACGEPNKEDYIRTVLNRYQGTRFMPLGNGWQIYDPKQQLVPVEGEIEL